MEEYKRLIDKLLELTSFLEDEYVFQGNEAYPPFLEGIARKSYYYLYALRYLADDLKNGNAVMDLSRSLLESLITLMFVQEFGKERKAKEFFFYEPIETEGDRQYALDANFELPADAMEKRLKEYETVKVDYLRPTKKEIARDEAKKALNIIETIGITLTDKNKTEFLEKMTAGKSDEEIINKSPLGIDLETMMLELDKKGKFRGNMKESIDRIYVYGNRKNHVSATDISQMVGKIERIERNHGYHMDIGLYASLFSYVTIMFELAELRNDPELKKKLENIKVELLSIAEKTNSVS